MLRVGDVVAGRYRVCALIGQGGMGTVFDAVNTSTERHVALKVLRAREASEERSLRRFLREGKLASRLEHHNIVDVLDMGRDADGTVFIVQELLRGQTLRAALAEPVALEASLAIAIAMCDALAYAHERGLVHRDVKPENIFLARDAERRAPTPKLIDFGIARALESTREDPALTESGVALGTAHYMAPEQARSSNDADARSDLWSVGAVLFELCTGRPPFVGPSFNTVVAQLLTQRPPRADKIAPDLATAIASVIERALEPEPSLRVQSAFALRAALIEAAREAGVTPSLDGLIERVSQDAPRALDHDGIDGSSASGEERRMTESFDGSTDNAPDAELSTPARITEEIAPVSTAHTKPPATRARRARDTSMLVGAALLAVAAGVALPLVKKARSDASASLPTTVAAAPQRSVASPRSPVTPPLAREAVTTPAPSTLPSTIAPAGPSPTTARDAARPATARGRRPLATTAVRVDSVSTISRATEASPSPSTLARATRANNGAPLLPAE